jgi:hypothetical protein
MNCGDYSMHKTGEARQMVKNLDCCSLTPHFGGGFEPVPVEKGAKTVILQISGCSMFEPAAWVVEKDGKYDNFGNASRHPTWKKPDAWGMGEGRCWSGFWLFSTF